MTGLLVKGREFWLWGFVAGLGTLAFLIAPGEASEKSRAVLHGLCAQTPTHSFDFGDTLLPFDGRMTGIYGGAMFTFAWLAISRRILFYGNPPLRMILVLAIGVGLMAIDGFNSLFVDLQIWHPYEPRNELRLITGYITGIALAVALCWLLGSSIWKLSQPNAGVRTWQDLVVPVAWFLPYAAMVLSGWTHFLLPLTWMLMAAAWLTLTVLMLVIGLLIFRYEDQIGSTRQLHVPGAVASALALVIMLGLAGGRFWLERLLGIPAMI